MKKIVGALAVFVITYALFSAAGYLFPVDQEWYNSLKNRTGRQAELRSASFGPSCLP